MSLAPGREEPVVTPGGSWKQCYYVEQSLFSQIEIELQEFCILQKEMRRTEMEV